MRSLTHLERLEAESIHIFREVVAEAENPVMLYSVGKDSSVMLHLARKAFYPAPPPFPMLHVASGWDFADLLAHRDRTVREYGLKLIIAQNEEAEAQGINPFDTGSALYSQAQLTDPLKRALTAHGFDAAFGGGRRDEEKARAKERIFSHRDSFGQWQPKAQRPELWTLFNTRLQPGEHFRVFPISNWTELDVWQYIDREQIGLPSIYYTHKRQVVDKKGLLMPVTELTPAREGDVVETRDVRFRTVGDITCTAPVESTAATPAEIVIETLAADVSERGATRMDDKTSDASMEKRKKDGYF